MKIMLICVRHERRWVSCRKTRNSDFDKHNWIEHTLYIGGVEIEKVFFFTYDRIMSHDRFNLSLLSFI